MSMGSDVSPLVLKLVDLFGTAGLLGGFVWILLRALKEQYESRINVLEGRIQFYDGKIDECNKDRQQIWSTMDGIRKEQLSELRKMHELTIKMSHYNIGKDKEE